MTTYVLHLHHKMLFETLTEPIENRINYIKEEKPEHERETRLSAMRILTPSEVKTIPKGVMKKYEAYDKAMEAYYKTEEAYVKAREACEKAEDAFVDACNTPAMIKWHKKVCKYKGCPWNGETLFP